MTDETAATEPEKVEAINQDGEDNGAGEDKGAGEEVVDAVEKMPDAAIAAVISHP